MKIYKKNYFITSHWKKYYYHFKINKKHLVKQLATVLYKDSKISLARKYEKASILFEDNNEEDIVYSDH